MHLALIPCLLAAVLLVGCGRPSEPAPTGQARAGRHVHRPLMGGQLVEVGEHQFNLELKFDPARGVLKVWILDAHAENFVRVRMAAFDVQEEGGAQRTITLRAVANPLSGETAGDTSSFEGDAPWLRQIEHFDGVVRAIRVRDLDFRDISFHFHPNE